MSAQTRSGAFFLILSALLLPHPCIAQEDQVPNLEGHVTRGAAIDSFDVNGIAILVDKNTRIGTRSGGHVSYNREAAGAPYIGECAQIFGKLDKKKHTLQATGVLFSVPSPHEVDGAGIIDKVDTLPPVTAPATPPATSKERIVLADGYRVSIGGQTRIEAHAPLTAASPIDTNLWMTFHGKQRPDGIVAADRITLSRNAISDREDKLLAKSDYDPKAVDPNAKQGAMSKVFRGIDPKQIPPYDDKAMQARVSAIGAKLVPRYQRRLAPQDDTKIDFQFQVVDMKKWHNDARTLPNGIILVPRQVAERLTDDSQLAAVLADNIACAVEKQTYRSVPGVEARSSVEVAGAVAGIFVPGLVLLTGTGTSVAAARALRLSEEQSGRVSLFLLHDAGYDIQQAPMAWWLLASKKPKDPADISMPHRAAYLYETLATTWRQP